MDFSFNGVYKENEALLKHLRQRREEYKEYMEDNNLTENESWIDLCDTVDRMIESQEKHRIKIQKLEKMDTIFHIVMFICAVIALIYFAIDKATINFI